MNMFKEGEYVRVKYDLHKIEDFEGGYVSSMSEFSGKVYRINGVSERRGYMLEGIPYIWDERALELAESDSNDGVQFKVGDKVVINSSCVVGGLYEGISLCNDMVFKGVTTIERIDSDGTMQVKGFPFWYTSPMLVKYSEEMSIKEDKKVDRIKNVSFDEVKLTRKEFKDVVMEVATEFITNPPKECEGRTAFMLAMTVPIIGDKIANRLFGEEKKEEE